MSTKKHDVPEALLAGLLADYQKPEDLIGENGLLKQLTKLLVEKALDAEMSAHLGHGKHEPVANPAGNTRNGKSRKTLKGDFGELPIEIPRDRHGTFEPQLIPKHQTRWTGFDDKVISLYARGMTVREIQAHLEEMYGTDISPSLISSITDAVADEVKAWQSWRRNWARLIPFFDYPQEIRRVIYTTNAIESVNMSLRKLTKNRGSFPSDEALTKLFYLALRNISQKWTMPIRDWKAALTRFTIQFEERIR